MRKLRFLHIPKTAGTSFYGALCRLYSGNHFALVGHLDIDLAELERFSPANLATFSLFGGHGPRRLGHPAIDALPTVTLLREPIARVISFCRHVSEGKAPYLLEQFPPARFDLDVFLASGNIELANYQTRTLLGNGSYELPDAKPDELVGRALDVLTNDIVQFGLVERFDQSLVLFKRAFGWDWPFYARANESGPTRLRFTRDHIRTIAEYNHLDLDLYRSAQVEFRRRWGQSRARNRSELVEFRMRAEWHKARSQAYVVTNSVKSLFGPVR